MWTPPLESTHQELSFKWSHLWVSLDSSGFRRFLGLVKFAFGSERVINRPTTEVRNEAHSLNTAFLQKEIVACSQQHLLSLFS